MMITNNTLERVDLLQSVPYYARNLSTNQNRSNERVVCWHFNVVTVVYSLNTSPTHGRYSAYWNCSDEL